MRLILSFLIVVTVMTLMLIVDLTVDGERSPLFSPENVARVRANIPKEVELSLAPIPVQIDPVEVRCMQQNIYFESRNQQTRGQIATAWVTLNRVNSILYPSTVCSVVKQAEVDSRGNPIRYRCKFSWYCDGLSDEPDLNNPVEARAWDSAGELARTMIGACLLGIDPVQCPEDPTNGALYYHTDEVSPSWSQVYVVVAEVGNHIFYRRN